MWKFVASHAAAIARRWVFGERKRCCRDILLETAARAIMASLNDDYISDSRCFAARGSHSNVEMKFVVCDCKNSCLRGKAFGSVARTKTQIAFMISFALRSLWCGGRAIFWFCHKLHAGQVEQTTKCQHSLYVMPRGNSFHVDASHSPAFMR